jgi:hypothetical protein
MSVSFGNLRKYVCVVLALASGVCLYMGLGPLLSLREAIGDAVFEREPDADLCLDLRLNMEETVMALCTTSQSVADPDERIRALAARLNELAPGRTGNTSDISYMLWKDTSVIHSPGFPDLTGRNFTGDKDIDGRLFAQDMARNAKSGGGFTLFTPDAERGAILAYSAPLPVVDGLHLSVYAPARFNGDAKHEPGPMYNAGLCLTGLSFAGLSALCRPRRKEEEGPAAPSREDERMRETEKAPDAKTE